MSPLDLIKYKSIRKISIFVCFISLIQYALFYGPLNLIDKFDFNVYINGLVVSTSSLLTYPFIYWKI